jgi:DNA-binding CsgD family transcriptional regulator
VPDLLLTDAEQAALRALLAAGPVPGMPVDRKVLQHLGVLVPCDAIAVAVADPSGCVLDRVRLPAGPHRVHGVADGIVVGFRNGSNHVVRLTLGRSRRPFSDRDLAVLRMIAPALERLLRYQPTPRLPAALTVQERRVLQLVAAGLSNTMIADRLYVAPCTIRKHLEHVFRKLGVTNRLAAVVAFEGPPLTGQRRLDQGEEFAWTRMASSGTQD